MVAVLSTSSCKYDSEEELYGVCDTTQVTYSVTITGLLNGYGCLGCHSGPNPNAGVFLDNHASIVSNINRVWGAINHAYGFKPMPNGRPKMSPCDINKIRAWMDAGLPNN